MGESVVAFDLTWPLSMQLLCCTVVARVHSGLILVQPPLLSAVLEFA